jgi:hypothetical protein
MNERLDQSDGNAEIEHIVPNFMARHNGKKISVHAQGQKQIYPCGLLDDEYVFDYIVTDFRRGTYASYEPIYGSGDL